MTSLDTLRSDTTRLVRQGELELATSIVLEAIDSEPRALPVAAEIATMLFSAQHFAPTADFCHRVLDRYPTASYFANYGGIAYRKAGKLRASVRMLLQALEHSPEHADLRVSLGNTFAAGGWHRLAIDSFRRAIATDAANTHAHFNLGNAWLAIGRPDAAISAYRDARRLAPNRADVAANLGVALAAINEHDEARNELEQSVNLAPDHGAAHFNLSLVLDDLDDHDQATASLDRAIQPSPGNELWKLRRQRMWPLVFADAREIETFRKSLVESLDAWPEVLKHHSLADACAAGLMPPFNTAHQTDGDRELRERFATCIATCQPINVPRPTKASGRPRIGWIVTPGHEKLFLRCCARIVAGLATREDWEHVLLVHNSARPLLAELLENARIQYRPLPTELRTAAKTIADESCDLLYHWEIGTDSLNYYLPLLSLAPIQCTSWGTMTTSGIAAVDYYLSSDLVEPAGAERNFTEKLVRLRSLLSDQPRVGLPARTNIDEFGLKAGRYYVCIQNLLKIHPATDQLFGDILRADGQGRLLLKHRRNRFVGDKLAARFSRTIPDVADRIDFLPWQSRDDYYRLIQAADCLLDTPHYGAGSSCYDAFSANQPMVTLPGNLNIGRYAQACYRQMEITDPVASDPDDYVAKAVRLASDADYRHWLRERIAAASDRLFDDRSVTEEYGRFFVGVLSDHG